MLAFERLDVAAEAVVLSDEDLLRLLLRLQLALDVLHVNVNLADGRVLLSALAPGGGEGVLDCGTLVP
jgi:hypothetical protein